MPGPQHSITVWKSLVFSWEEFQQDIQIGTDSYLQHLYQGQVMGILEAHWCLLDKIMHFPKSISISTVILHEDTESLSKLWFTIFEFLFCSELNRQLLSCAILRKLTVHLFLFLQFFSIRAACWWIVSYFPLVYKLVSLHLACRLHLLNNRK